MEVGSSDSRGFATALVATTLVVVGFVAYVRWSTPVAWGAGVDATTRAEQPAFDLARRAHASTPPAKPAAIATIYECEVADQKVFSDRPCSEDARVREVMAPNGMRATRATGPRTASVRSHSGPAASAGSAEPTARSKDSQCKFIDDEIDSINARMRQPYTASEGEDYRERLRRLDDERWDAKCRMR